MNQSKLRAIFDKSRKKEGGVLDYESMPEWMRANFTVPLEDFRKTLSGTANSSENYYVANNIYIDIIDNSTVNAVAFTAQGHEFIGVNKGALLSIYSTLQALFAHPRFLPHVGDPSRENLSDSGLRDFLQQGTLSRVDPIEPKCAERQRGAQFLTINACTFLLAHEVGHITKAHLIYLNEEHGLAENYAYPPDDGETNLSNLRHVLEIGADENAVHGSIAIWGPTREPYELPGAGGLKQDFAAWLAGVASIFVLFDRHAKKAAPKSHPDTDVRYYNVVTCACNFTKRKFPEMANRCLEESALVSAHFHEFLSSVGMPTTAFDFAQNEDKARRKETIEDLVQRTGQLMEQLESVEDECMEAMAKARNIRLRSNTGGADL